MVAVLAILIHLSQGIFPTFQERGHTSHKDRLLAGEVMIKSAFGQPGSPGYFADGGVVVAETAS